MLASLLFLLAGLFLPLYPLSIGINLLLQRASTANGGGRLAQPAARTALILLTPLIGVGLIQLGLSLGGDQGRSLITVFAVWGGLTSLLYAFRLLSVRDGQIWIAQLYSSALALIWIGAAHQAPLLLPALGLALSLLPLLWLLSELSRRFGIARVGLYPGLGIRMPVFASLFVAAVLVAIGVPFSPAFFAVANIAFGGVGANELLTLVPVGLAWLLWTWAGVNLLTGLVVGVPREDLAYRDFDRAAALRYGGAMLALSLFGIYLVEGAL